MPDLYEITKRYGLAACCIVGPLLFGLGGDYYATQRLVAVPDPTIALRYLPSTPPGYCGSASEIRGHLAASFTAAGVSPAAPTQRPSAQAVAPPCPDANDKIASPPYSEADDPNNVLKFWTIGQQYRGRITYAVASAFLFLIAGVVLIFALSIVAPKLKWLGTIAALIVFAVIAVYCAQNSYRPAGRTLIVEKLLGSADVFFRT